MKTDWPLHAVGPADVPKAACVLAEAFARDPFFSYMLGGWAADRDTINRFHEFTLRYGMRYGSVWAPSENLEGIAIWLPSGRVRMTAWRSVRAGVLRLWDLPFPSRADRRSFLRRMGEYGKYSGALHRKHAPFPHWYLMSVGVADACRGLGFAGKLIRPVLSSLDAEGLPCFLETHNPANVPLYEHFGFRVAEEGRLPGTDRPHWAMLRAVPQ